MFEITIGLFDVKRRFLQSIHSLSATIGYKLANISIIRSLGFEMTPHGEYFTENRTKIDLRNKDKIVKYMLSKSRDDIGLLMGKAAY